MSKPVENIAELTSRTAQYLHDLETDATPVKKASELFNGVGKIISAQKTRLEYFALRKEAPSIPFLAATK